MSNGGHYAPAKRLWGIAPTRGAGAACCSRRRSTARRIVANVGRTARTDARNDYPALFLRHHVNDSLVATIEVNPPVARIAIEFDRTIKVWIFSDVGYRFVGFLANASRKAIDLRVG